MCVGVLSVGLGPGLDSMSPARSRRSASHAAGTHGRLPQKTGRPGLRRGGVGGYNLHSVPPNSPPDCGTVAHQPRAGCIRLVLTLFIIYFFKNHYNSSTNFYFIFNPCPAAPEIFRVRYTSSHCYARKFYYYYCTVVIGTTRLRGNAYPGGTVRGSSSKS